MQILSLRGLTPTLPTLASCSRSVRARRQWARCDSSMAGRGYEQLVAVRRHSKPATTEAPFAGWTTALALAAARTWPPEEPEPEAPNECRSSRRRSSQACVTAGIAHRHPRDLRHRYASVKIAEGVPVTTLTAQLGHSKKSMTLDVYSHVLLDG